MRPSVSAALLAAAVVVGCAANRAASDCEALGFTSGTAEFQQCAERQLQARRERAAEYQRQQTQIRIECERASAGLFGRRTGTQDGTCR